MPYQRCIGQRVRAFPRWDRNAREGWVPPRLKKDAPSKRTRRESPPCRLSRCHTWRCMEAPSPEASYSCFHQSLTPGAACRIPGRPEATAAPGPTTTLAEDSASPRTAKEFGNSTLKRISQGSNRGNLIMLQDTLEKRIGRTGARALRRLIGPTRFKQNSLRAKEHAL